MSFDAVIVGGGILGTSCADALARDGARVAIVEPTEIGGGATAAGMGHIVVIDEPPGEFALSHYSNILWEQLAPQLPKSAEYSHPGTIWVAEDDEEMAAVETKNRSYRSVGIASEPLDATALARLEPNLRPGLPGGLLVPREPVVYAPVAARFLADRSRAHILHEAVRSVADSGVTLASGKHVAAGAVIVAAGAQSGTLIEGLPVLPRKGHLAITDRYPGFLNHQLVELGYIKSAHGNAAEAVAFNIQPRPTAQLLIGSSRQYGVATTAIDTHMLRRVLNRAIHFMPAIASMSVIRAWTGFRPATPDGMPFIGRWRGNVWLATGHEGLGVTTAPGSAQLLADLMANRTPAIDPTPYLPERLQHAR